jgi:hypothetical protein
MNETRQKAILQASVLLSETRMLLKEIANSKSLYISALTALVISGVKRPDLLIL